MKNGRFNVYQAAKHYGLSQPTLWHWCQRNDVNEIVPSVGRPCYLGNSLEEKLKKWILEAARTGILFEFPLTTEIEMIIFTRLSNHSEPFNF